MESANEVPFCNSGYDAFDIRWVVPVPGLTGLAITSHRSHNLVKLISSANLVAGPSRGQRRHVSGLVYLTACHDRPDDARRLVGHSDRRHPHGLSCQQIREARIDRPGIILGASD